MNLHRRLLINNRRRMVAHFLPRTATRLGGRFEGVFLTYGDDHWPPADGLLFDDAISFAKWLKETKVAINSAALDKSELRSLKVAALKAKLRRRWLDFARWKSQARGPGDKISREEVTLA